LKRSETNQIKPCVPESATADQAALLRPFASKSNGARSAGKGGVENEQNALAAESGLVRYLSKLIGVDRERLESSQSSEKVGFRLKES
jgi:hypothetical protein